MAEIRLATVVVRQRAVVHHLQQQVEHFRVRLFHFVEQQHAVRVLSDGFREQTALVEAHIARGRADEARYRVAFHVFAHVEAQQFHAKRNGQLARHFCLAHARGASKQEGTHRLAVIAQARTRQLDGGGKRVDGRVLPEDDKLQIPLEVLQYLAIRRRHLLRRNARNTRHHRFHLCHVYFGRTLVHRLQAQVRSRFVHHVDGFVGQVAVIDVASSQLRGGTQRLVLILHPVVLFVPRLETLQYLEGFLHGGLHHIYLLEAPRERVVLFEDAAIFLVGGRANTAQLAIGKHGLDEIRGVHDATRSGTRTDDGVDFVDEEDGARLLVQFREHALQALFKVAAVLGAGNERAHVQGPNGAVRKHIRHFAFGDETREAFGNSRFAHARLAHVERVVLAATAENFDGALHLKLTPDERVDTAFGGELVEVGAVFLESVTALRALLLAVGGRRFVLLRRLFL